ncbi:DNRLRE domain-containing protein [Paenibacillus lentus]|uniref:DNRLRE domain-containing protein n=1 Tax=Paenibacillus lentus TaxID=1338368 RepID=A0A3Q8S537_9BACL|nr:DNRLRE domain-containing protein [Paenibacillus lentus]AZK47110.1 DNRLRE domain-containing protein [Paenibacillus lentus]
MFRIIEQTQAQMQQGYFSNSDIYVDGYGKLTLVNRNMQTNLALNKPYTKTLNSPLDSRYGDTGNRLFTDGNKSTWFQYSNLIEEDIVVDLGLIQSVGGACLYTNLNPGAGGNPRFVEFYGSINGVDFSYLGEDGISTGNTFNTFVTSFHGSFRYLKFKVKRPSAYVTRLAEGEIYSGISYTSYREHIYDISSVGVLRTNNAFWVDEIPFGTTVTVETSISLDGGGTWSTWKPLANGSSIQNAPLGTDISNGRLKIRTALSTNSINVPSFYNFNMYFDDTPKTDEKYIIIPRNAYSLNKITPEMTSSNEPAPYVVTGTGTNETSYPSWKLFDGLASPSSLNDMWRPYGVGTYVQLDLGSGNAKAVSGYRLQKNASSTGLTGFRIEGSFDGVDWVTVDEQSAVIWSGNELFQQISPLKTNEVYRYFRLYMTTGERPYLTELELFELVDGNGYQIKSSLIVPYGTSLPSMLYIPPHNKATGYVDVRPIYHENLPARVSIKVHDNLSCRINIPINNRASAIVKIVQPPTKMLSLSPIKDAFVREGTPKFNYGTEQDLYVGYNSKFSEKYRSFVKFDISVLPADQIIKSAHFKLFHELEGTPVQKVEIYELDREWNERGVTWDNQPVPTIKIAEVDVGGVGGYLSVDFTDIVKDWYNGSQQNKGFMIKLADENEQYYKRFYSKESRHSPILDIEYLDQTVYTYERADLRNNRIVVRQSNDKAITAKLTIHQIWYDQDIKSRIKIANMGVIDGSLIVKAPVLLSRITVRQSEQRDLTAKLNVQIKKSEDILSQITVSRDFAFGRIRVRQRKDIGLASRIAIRVSEELNLPTTLAVINPNLSAKISVVKSEYLAGTIHVIGQEEKLLLSKIVIRRNENKDLPAHIRVFEKATLPATIHVISAYIPCRISIPTHICFDQPSRIRVRVKWASDLMSRIVIDDPNGDSQGYVYIL